MLTNLNGLTNGDQCKIDAKLIGELGANVVRVYSVDPTLNHDACMNAFAENGIYVIVDMSTPTYSINRVRTPIPAGGGRAIAKLAWSLSIGNTR